MSDRDDALRRLEAGQEPKTGDLMALFGASRSSVHRFLRDGVRVGDRRFVIRYRLLPGGDRVANVDDVRRVLVETERWRSADDPEGVRDLTEQAIRDSTVFTDEEKQRLLDAKRRIEQQPLDPPSDAAKD